VIHGAISSLGIGDGSGALSARLVAGKGHQRQRDTSCVRAFYVLGCAPPR
jgi:hypothetical protein